MNVYEKLNRIQTGLVAPKGQYNNFGKYKYRSCEDVLEAVKPLLKELNLVLLLGDEVERTGDSTYIKATATVIDADKPEDKISTSAYAKEEETKKGMDSAQITGSTSSYARKYALSALLAIDDNKDSDATKRHEDEPKPTQKKQAPSRPPEQKEDPYALPEDAGLLLDPAKTIGGERANSLQQMAIKYASNEAEAIQTLKDMLVSVNHKGRMADMPLELYSKAETFLLERAL